jgi:lysophospholipase L1-like esterase
MVRLSGPPLLALLSLCAVPLAAAPAATRTRVLCFGDSLTAGFWAGGSRFHPYAQNLSALLGGCTVDVIDNSGWTAKQMRDSLDAEVGHDSVGLSWQRLPDVLASAAAIGEP